MNSGCSRNMSGVRNGSGGPARLKDVREVVRTRVRGFDGTVKEVGMEGVNEDNKSELFIESMPQDLVLLCAKQYAEDGAIVLFSENGYVLSMNEQDVKELKKYLEQCEVKKYLVVKEGTYHVQQDDVSENRTEELVMMANTYFNTKVNVSNGEERVLAYMLSGFTWDMLWQAIEKQNVLGLHPGLTKTLLSRFARKWGKTPDVAQLAHPNVLGNEKGYMSKREEVKEVGVIQMDLMSWDFNEPELNYPTVQTGKWPTKRRRKLMTFGGAIAAAVVVDEKTQFCFGKLVKSTEVPLNVIKETFSLYQRYGHNIKTFKADSGISTSSDYKVFTTEVDKYLFEKGCNIVKAEPYNHSNGIPMVERMIQSIKNRMRLAFQYVFNNKNVLRLGFLKPQLARLWGEIFYWAVGMENLRTAPGVDITRYEAFRETVPHIQEFRLLPIFSVVKIYRHQTSVVRDGNPNRGFYQHALYVGGCPEGKGVIRAAVLVNGRVHLIRTSKYKGVSDGGDANEYESVERGTQLMVDEMLDEVRDDVGIQQVQGVNWDDGINPNVNPANHNNPNVPVVNPNTLVVQNVPVVSNVSNVPVVSGGEEDQVQQSVEVNDFHENVNEVINEKDVDERETSTTGRSRGRKSGSTTKQTVTSRKTTTRVEECDDNDGNGSEMNQVQVVRRGVIDHGHNTRSKKVNHQSNIVEHQVNNVEWMDYEIGDCYAEVVRGEVWVIECNAAVVEGVPRNFKDALIDPVWGEAARQELDLLTNIMNTLVPIRHDDGKRMIEQGADKVVLFPVYEKKIKEGKEVKKVRLVCNGKTQYGAEETYSPTPSRLELYVLLEVAITEGWELAHLDESRAFLSAKYRGETPVVAMVRGIKGMFQVEGALYGLKTSPRDYNEEVLRRLNEMGFVRDIGCCCLFKRFC